MTIAPGLCSITFRALTATEVLEAAVQAGVEGIEWGADGHAPPGGGVRVAELAQRCADAGVEIVSYGSYLGFGPADQEDPGTVDAVIETAAVLGAPMIRIWTELGVGPAAAGHDRQRVTDRTQRYVDRLVGGGFDVALEFHPYTLTETAASTNALLDAIASASARTHWQPDPALTPDAAIAELAAVTPRLAHLHVFAWGPGGIGERLALADGVELWTGALAVADEEAVAMSRRRFALCEYVQEDDPEQLVADVAVLRRWLASD